MAPTFAEVAKADYVLLTTFTKDGRAKPTAVWAVPEGERLLVLTQATSWKVKRIRNTPRVTVAVCDRRGNPKSEPAEAVAGILDSAALARTYDGIGARYGLFGKVFNLFSKLRGGMKNNVALELRAAA
jgi:PPOX class probable F420-dependent enzyme